MLLPLMHEIDNAHFRSSSLTCFVPLLILQSFEAPFISYVWLKTRSEDKFIYFTQAVVWCSSSEDTSDSAILFLLQPGKSQHLSCTDDKRCAGGEAQVHQI